MPSEKRLKESGLLSGEE